LSLLILVHLHGIGGLRCSVLLRLGLNLGSLGSLPLFADGLRLLLLLNARCWWSSGRRRLEIHGWHKRLCELLLRDEWMQLGLLWRPALQRIDMKQATNKVDEGNAIVKLCKMYQKEN
jgi:hypothetical protein